MTHHYIKVNNIKIHYIESHSEAEVTILFIHGRALSVNCWERQFDSETLSNFRLIALDLPGHGLSDGATDFNTNYSVAGYTNLLANFVQQLNLENYILAGLSLGGHIALQTLPILQDCLGVFAMTMPVTKPMEPILMYQNFDLLEKVYQENALSGNVSLYTSQLLSPNASETPQFTQDSYFATDHKIHEGIINGLIAGEYLDEVDIIKNATVPVALIAGEEEQILDLNYLMKFDLPIWRGAVQMVPDAGHLVNWENAEVVNGLLRRFAEDCFTNKSV